MVFRLRPENPITAAATLKVVDFVRALIVDSYTVWAPNDDWSAVNATHDVLVDRNFTVCKLEDALDRDDVCSFRLLRGAVACLAPAFVGDQGLRVVLADVLKALRSTANSQELFVTASAEGAPGASSAVRGCAGNHPALPHVPSFSNAHMACAPDVETVTPAEFSAT